MTSLTKEAVVNPYSEGLLILYRTRPHSRRSTLRLAGVFRLFPPVAGSTLGPDSDPNQNLYGKKVGADHLWAAVQKPSSSEELLAVLGEKSSMRPVEILAALRNLVPGPRNDGLARATRSANFMILERHTT